MAEWLWLKVDAEGRPVAPVGSGGGGGEGGGGGDGGSGDDSESASHDGAEAAGAQRGGSTSCPRRAYEPLVLARFVGTGARSQEEGSGSGTTSPELPARAVLVAPVREHSRKPRLGAFIQGACVRRACAVTSAGPTCSRNFSQLTAILPVP